MNLTAAAKVLRSYLLTLLEVSLCLVGGMLWSRGGAWFLTAYGCWTVALILAWTRGHNAGIRLERELNKRYGALR